VGVGKKIEGKGVRGKEVHSPDMVGIFDRKLKVERSEGDGALPPYVFVRDSGCKKRIPKWEEYPHTPGVFVRVANAGLTGYVTWKSVRRMGAEREGKESRWHPPVYVRAESKGVTGVTVLQVWEIKELRWRIFRHVRKRSGSARMELGKHGIRIACGYQVVKCFAGNGGNWGLNGNSGDWELEIRN
jgi:hypothetical protein